MALSRARYLLYIVGDKDFCENREGILGEIEGAYHKIKDDEKLEEEQVGGRVVGFLES